MKSSEKQSILIVDDSRTNIMALAELLKDEWAIKIANNGATALRIAESKSPPDLILLDVMMPEMDGYEVCKRLKESPITKDIPVIFVTAMDSLENEEFGLSLGAIDYITKPISPPIVKARVRNHLELKKYRDILKESSRIDGLTGISNRRRFDEALSAEWRRALRYGSSLSLIMIDIDHFKNYNDSYGHLGGDECLRQVAQSLHSIPKRPLDLVARYGGEEFACLLPETEFTWALKIAEDLRSNVLALQLPHKSSPLSEQVTVSLGLTTLIPQKGQEAQFIIEEADRALYTAKEAGRNQVSWSNSKESSS
ncbi:diguanylate cyclase domain-containing protein [Heliorestis acidaminivorans]|nr:diguanylate cyclase [Heliorestis acidaminivorans]